MDIRKASLNDLDEITAIEAECFPAAEACGKESFVRRLSAYPDHFWLAVDGEKIIGFVNGLVTDEQDLRDEMYDEASMHNENGAWQMIFGVDTLPSYRRQGVAEKVLNTVIAEAAEQNRKGLVLTCKDRLIHYYAKFNFVNEGISGSTHGDVVWYQMRLTF